MWVCAGGGCPVVVWVCWVCAGLVSLVVFCFFFFEVALVAIGVVAGGGRRCLCRWWPLVMMMKIVIGIERI